MAIAARRGDRPCHRGARRRNRPTEAEVAPTAMAPGPRREKRPSTARRARVSFELQPAIGARALDQRADMTAGGTGRLALALGLLRRLELHRRTDGLFGELEPRVAEEFFDLRNVFFAREQL